MGIEAFKAELRNSCGAFITISNATQKAALYHQSIRESFLDISNPYALTRDEAEIHCATACLTYLSLSDLTEALPDPRLERETYQHDSQLLTEFPLLEYATVQWPHHVVQAPGDFHLWNLFVSWAHSDNIGLWCHIYWRRNGTGDRPSDLTPLHIFCYLGLEYFVSMASTEDGSRPWALMAHICDSLKRTP